MHVVADLKTLTRRSALAMLAGALVSSVAHAEETPVVHAGVSATFTGRLHTDREVRSFAPDGIAERWWFDGDKRVWDAIEAMSSARNRDLRAIITGTPSELGRFGHMSRYVRRVTVTAIRAEPPTKTED